jgi:hypothetical protein
MRFIKPPNSFRIIRISTGGSRHKLRNEAMKSRKKSAIGGLFLYGLECLFAAANGGGPAPQKSPSEEVLFAFGYEIDDKQEGRDHSPFLCYTRLLLYLIRTIFRTNTPLGVSRR